MVNLQAPLWSVRWARVIVCVPSALSSVSQEVPSPVVSQTLKYRPAPRSSPSQVKRGGSVPSEPHWRSNQVRPLTWYVVVPLEKSSLHVSRVSVLVAQDFAGAEARRRGGLFVDAGW